MKYLTSTFNLIGLAFRLGSTPTFQAAGRWQLLAAATHRNIVTAGTVEKNDAEVAFLAEAEEPWMTSPWPWLN